MAATPDQVLYASRAWLHAVRRAWIKRHAGEECWLPVWEALSAADRIDLMAAIQVALIAAEPANVKRAMERVEDSERSQP